MKVLVLGKNGQVGQALQQALLSTVKLGIFEELIFWGREELDLTNLSALSKKLDTVCPNIIINAAAYTAVDKAEKEEERCHLINTLAVEKLADYTAANGSLLVHYSTDYVFDGTKSSSYIETDFTRPLNVYGQSKLAGEKVIYQRKCNALIFRTSWVISAYGNNFIKTVLKLAQDRDYLNIINDQYGAPTSAQLIADVTVRAIIAYQNASLDTGLYHLSAAGYTCWYDLAKLIIERALANRASLLLRTDAINGIPTSAYQTPAQRPSNSCLNTHKLSQALQFDFPDWRLGVNNTIDDLTQSEAFA